MDLAYTEFQEMLRNTVRDFAQRDFPVSRHRELVEQGITFDEATWKKMAGLGWLGLPIQERYGGGGGSWVDLVVLLEEMGRALIPYTYLAQALAGAVIQAFGTEAQKQALLPGLAAGDRVFAVAVAEERGTFTPDGIQCTAAPEPGRYVLNGSKWFVRGGNAADALVVAARLADGLGLFLVDRSEPGIAVTPLPNIGDDDQARVELAQVTVPEQALLGGGAQGWEALDRILEMGALMECGYAVGLMARDLEMTIDYVKDRVQFGRPLGTFQAVQHQVADQVTDVDCGRFLTYYAAWAAYEGVPEAGLAAARAKAWVSDALRRVTRTGNQLHGGIGFTKEYDLHFYYQRAKTSELMYGLADEHRERVAAALLDG